MRPIAQQSTNTGADRAKAAIHPSVSNFAVYQLSGSWVFAGVEGSPGLLGGDELCSARFPRAGLGCFPWMRHGRDQ